MDSWEKWGKHVLKELDKVAKKQETIADKLNQIELSVSSQIQKLEIDIVKKINKLETQSALIKVKSSFWGLGAGSLPSIVGAVLDSIK